MSCRISFLKRKLEISVQATRACAQHPKGGITFSSSAMRITEKTSRWVTKQTKLLEEELSCQHASVIEILEPLNNIEGLSTSPLPWPQFSWEAGGYQLVFTNAGWRTEAGANYGKGRLKGWSKGCRQTVETRPHLTFVRRCLGHR